MTEDQLRAWIVKEASLILSVAFALVSQVSYTKGERVLCTWSPGKVAADFMVAGPQDLEAQRAGLGSLKPSGSAGQDFAQPQNGRHTHWSVIE